MLDAILQKPSRSNVTRFPALRYILIRYLGEEQYLFALSFLRWFYIKEKGCCLRKIFDIHIITNKTQCANLRRCFATVFFCFFHFWYKIISKKVTDCVRILFTSAAYAYVMSQRDRQATSCEQIFCSFCRRLSDYRSFPVYLVAKCIHRLQGWSIAFLMFYHISQ